MKINTTWANAQITQYQDEYALFNNYYKGEHQVYLNGIKTYKHLKDLLKGTKSNVCQSIVDIVANRIILSGIHTPENDEINEFLTNYFHTNRVGSFFSQIIRDCLIFGDAYVSLWFDKDNKLKLYSKNPFNTTVFYDENDEISMAVSVKFYKDLKNNPRSRMYVYTKDFIGFEDYEGHSIKGEVEISENNMFTNPLGCVPIFHLYNSNKPTDFAESELVNVIPLQRHLNSLHQLRAVASESSAFKQRYLLGYTPQYDSNGNMVNPFSENEVGHIFISTDENVTVGEWDATPLSNFTDVIDSIHREISIVTRIPQFLYNLGGNIPTSGLALKIAEQPLVNKIKSKQVILGDIIEDIFDIILKYNGYSNYGQLDAVWEDTSVVDEYAETQTVSNKIALGVKPEIALKELGYDVEQTTIEEDGFKSGF